MRTPEIPTPRMRVRIGRLLAVAAGAAAVGVVGSRLRPRYSLRGRSAVITGGSRGLGLVLARQLAEQGCLIALLARDAEELDQARRELDARGASVLAVRCDVRSQAEVNAAIEAVVDRHGAIDILINNAGLIQVGPVEHMTLEDFHSAFAVHFWGPLYTTLAVLPHMRRAGAGRIVNIASIGGERGVPHLVPYCASKFALVGLSEALRPELLRYGIVVTTVSPGLMRTGSPVHAVFKGDHEREYGWFSVAAALPLASMPAERAARQIIRALRAGSAKVILTLPARLMVVANALAPNLTSRLVELVARLLPGPAGAAGDAAALGWDSRGKVPAVLTRLSDAAAERNNELTALVGSAP
jgi:NAD(P)-dependent dehydrogenase (short-subunit alcohol dehydrogenase family)